MGTYPDWTLQGGWKRLVAWAVDAAGDPTGDAVSTHVGQVEPYSESPDYRTLDDGTLDETGRVRPLAISLSGWKSLRDLRAWREAGHSTRARLVAGGTGPHLIWDQAVPVHLAPYNGGRPGLAGDRLVLHTERAAAAVEQSPDLMARVPFGPGTGWTEVGSGGTQTPLTWETDADGHTVAVLESGSDGETTAAYVDVVLPAPGLAVNVYVPTLEPAPLLGATYPKLTAVPFAGASYVVGPSGDDLLYADPEEYGLRPFERAFRLPSDVWAVRVSVEVHADESPATAKVARFQAPVLLTRWADGSIITGV